MFEYFKSLQFSAMEVAVLHSALVLQVDKLTAMQRDHSLPGISLSNMRIEWDATQQALGKLAASRFEAVNAVAVKDADAEASRYKEFCRLRDYRKPGVEVCRYTEAEAFTLATRKPLKAAMEKIISKKQDRWSEKW